MAHDLLVPVAEGLVPRNTEYGRLRGQEQAAASAVRRLLACAGQLRFSADRPPTHRNGGMHEGEPRKPANLRCPCGNPPGRVLVEQTWPAPVYAECPGERNPLREGWQREDF